MVPDCHKRLETALADLKATLVSYKNFLTAFKFFTSSSSVNATILFYCRLNWRNQMNKVLRLERLRVQSQKLKLSSSQQKIELELIFMKSLQTFRSVGAIVAQLVLWCLLWIHVSILWLLSPNLEEIWHWTTLYVLACSSLKYTVKHGCVHLSVSSSSFTLRWLLESIGSSLKGLGECA